MVLRTFGQFHVGEDNDAANDNGNDEFRRMMRKRTQRALDHLGDPEQELLGSVTCWVTVPLDHLWMRLLVASPSKNAKPCQVMNKYL